MIAENEKGIREKTDRKVEEEVGELRRALEARMLVVEEVGRDLVRQQRREVERQLQEVREETERMFEEKAKLQKEYEQKLLGKLSG